PGRRSPAFPGNRHSGPPPATIPSIVEMGLPFGRKTAVQSHFQRLPRSFDHPRGVLDRAGIEQRNDDARRLRAKEIPPEATPRSGKPVRKFHPPSPTSNPRHRSNPFDPSQTVRAGIVPAAAQPGSRRTGTPPSGGD